MQIGITVASVCEIAVIIAHLFHSNAFAMQVMSLLMPNSDSLRAGQTVHVTKGFLIGCLLTNIGGLICLSCFRALGRLFTYELAVRKDHKLVTTGLYALVRHPAYTGGVFLMSGVALCHLSSGSWLKVSGVLGNAVVRGLVEGWVVLFICFQGMVFNRVKQEDNALRAAFGKSWDIWAEKTKYKLLPGIY